jgi:1-aminocyclopropane-1-carboxylate deaminase
VENPLTQLQSALPSPLQPVSLLSCCCSFKRDDLIHTDISGNKYRKLIPILQSILSLGKKGIITRGGAFSNHIYATAAASAAYQIPSIALIRGEDDPANPTLRFARAHGMQLHFIKREDYRNPIQDGLSRLQLSYPDYQYIPEGGHMPEAIDGCRDIVTEIQQAPNYIAVAAGTGATAAGIVQAIADKKWPTKVLVFPVLKDSSIKSMLEGLAVPKSCWEWMPGFEVGGYGKWDSDLLAFILSFHQAYPILLDPIYTSKLVFGLVQLDKAGYFAPQDHVIVYHSGGLQGWSGWKYLHAKKKNTDPIETLLHSDRLAAF